eukprot:UN09811
MALFLQVVQDSKGQNFQIDVTSQSLNLLQVPFEKIFRTRFKLPQSIWRTCLILHTPFMTSIIFLHSKMVRSI